MHSMGIPQKSTMTACAQVATPRVRTAVKAGIPHVDDPISKLHSLGVMTQGKLADIASAAAASGVYDLTPPLNSVATGAALLLCARPIPSCVSLPQAVV